MPWCLCGDQRIMLLWELYFSSTVQTLGTELRLPDLGRQVLYQLSHLVGSDDLLFLD